MRVFDHASQVSPALEITPENIKLWAIAYENRHKHENDHFLVNIYQIYRVS
jgi:hypothetical protein